MKELIVNHQLFVEDSHAGNVVDLQQLQMVIIKLLPNKLVLVILYIN